MRNVITVVATLFVVVFAAEGRSEAAVRRAAQLTLLADGGKPDSPTKRDVIGKWTYSDPDILYTREFKADGTATEFQRVKALDLNLTSTSKGTWSISGNQVRSIVKNSNGKATYERVYFLVGKDQLVWREQALKTFKRE